MTIDLSRTSFRLLATALGIALVGIVLAMGAQGLHAVGVGLALGLTDVELARDVVLAVLVPALAMSALGRLATEEQPSSEVLVRTERLAFGIGSSGVVLVGAALMLGADAMRSAIAGGIAVVAFAVGVDACGLLVRPPRTPGSWAHLTQRAAAVASLFAMPLVVVSQVLLVSERAGQQGLWRELGDLGACDAAIRDAASAFFPLALFAASGVLLDVVAAAARAPWRGVRSTRAALLVGGLLALAAFVGRLFGADAISIAGWSFPALLLLVPCTVVVGNAVLTLADGQLDATALRPAAIAALVLLVERTALAFPQVLLALRGELAGSGLAAAGDELGLAALAFLVASAVVISRPPAGASLAAVIAFVGVQLLVVARLVVSPLPRAYVEIPRLIASERVATLGIALVVVAGLSLLRTVLPLARAQRIAPTAS